MAEERYYQIPIKTRVWCTCVGEHVYEVPAIAAQVNSIEELTEMGEDTDHLALEVRRAQHGNNLDSHPETLAIAQAYEGLVKTVVVKVTTDDHEAYKADPLMKDAVELTAKQVETMVAEKVEQKRQIAEAKAAEEALARALAETEADAIGQL